MANVDDKYLVAGRDKSDFVKKTKNTDFTKNFFETDNQNPRVFDWQHICYAWWMCFSTDSRDIPMGTNCAPLLLDLFLYQEIMYIIQTSKQVYVQWRREVTARLVDIGRIDDHHCLSIPSITLATRHRTKDKQNIPTKKTTKMSNTNIPRRSQVLTNGTQFLFLLRKPPLVLIYFYPIK